jgi:hypothetical protein
MAIRQLSVFVENKKGTLHEITDVLAKSGIDLRSMCIADTSDYGIVRIIASEPERAKEVLNDAGHVANVRNVTAFAVPDQPGGLAQVLSILEENSIDIEYMYSLFTHVEGKAYIVFRVSDADKVVSLLAAHGITPSTAEELGIH